jgi:hypothetical protein
MLQGTDFQSAQGLLEALVQILSDIPLETLTITFHQWIERLQRCIVGQGEYMEQRSISLQNFLLQANGN